MSVRRLVVMRHGTSQRSGTEGDHARSLTPAGRKEPLRIAARLTRLGWVPDGVVSSDAQRTRETWSCMGSGLPALEPSFRRVLYHAGRDAFDGVVGALPTEVKTALILGHNPGWEAVVAYYGGVDVRMGPAFAALLQGEGETWWDALAGRWTLVDLIQPTDGAS